MDAEVCRGHEAKPRVELGVTEEKEEAPATALGLCHERPHQGGTDAPTLVRGGDAHGSHSRHAGDEAVRTTEPAPGGQRVRHHCASLVCNQFEQRAGVPRGPGASHDVELLARVPRVVGERLVDHSEDAFRIGRSQGGADDDHGTRTPTVTI